MMTEKPKSYVTVPRYIVEDYLDKKLTRSEYILCIWLRSISDIYGIATTGVTAIRDDMFPKVEINTVQKLLLSLRKKKYVWFPNHQGRRGSIRIESDDWLMKTKGTKSIAHYFDQKEATSDTASEVGVMHEPEQSLATRNQKFLEDKKLLVEGFSTQNKNNQITSTYNEHDNEKEKEKNTVGSSLNRTLTASFTPRNAEEQWCKETALKLGDEYINSILSVLRNNKRGFWVIEKAWEVYEENIKNGIQITNKPAYFYGITKKIAAKEL